MNLAYVSLAALVIAILVSCFTELNVGILSLALAYIVGVFLGGMKLDDVTRGFPISLFLTLAGVTMLFTQAQLNGTLDRIAHRAVRLCRGNVGVIPIMFFVLGCALASVGPGNVSTAALLGPMAMATASRAGIPAFLMIIMVGNGAQAGSLSPFAPTGIIVNGLMAKIGLAGHEWHNYYTNALAHAFVAFAGFFLFGGLKLFRLGYAAGVDGNDGADGADAAAVAFDRNNWITMAVIGALISGVLFLGVNVGMGAFVGAVFLAIVGAADHREAMKKMPWSVIMMMSGVTVLIALLEKTEGLDLFTSMLARFATPRSITGFIAFVTGIISVYSSTSGVVLPAFLPTIPGLILRLGGGDPISIATSMNVGAHLVDVSPLSTTGALCLAAMPASENVRKAFNQLLAWGLSMAVVGAVIAYLFF
jgi:di/tricarboxylate transporter